MEDMEEEILNEKETLPPQKNNLLNYFARKQTTQVKAPKVDSKKSKDYPEKKNVLNGLKCPPEVQRATEETSNCDLGGEGGLKVLPKDSRDDEVADKYPRKRKRRKKDDEDGLNEEEKPGKRKKELTKEESTAIAVSQLIQLSEDEESDKGKIEHSDEKPNSESLSGNIKSSEKSKKAISSFFVKVTKEERLAKAEVINTKIEVKAMIHQTTEADISASVFDDVLVGEVKTDGEVCDEKGAAGEDIEGEKVSKKKRKPRKSNVARPESEANSIEVVEVKEEEVLTAVTTEVPLNKEKSKKKKKLSAAESASKLFGGRGKILSASVVDQDDTGGAKESAMVEEVAKVKKPVEKESDIADLAGDGGSSTKISSKLFGRKGARGKGRAVSESEESISFDSPVKKAAGDYLEREAEADEEFGKDEAKQRSESLSVPAVEVEADENELVSKVKRGGKKTEQKDPVKISNTLFGGGRKRNRRPEKSSSEAAANSPSSASPSELTEGTAGDPGPISEHSGDEVKDKKTEVQPPRPGAGIKSAFAFLMSKSIKKKETVVEMVEIPDDVSDDLIELDPCHQPVKAPDENGDVDAFEDIVEVVREKKVPRDKRYTRKRSNVTRSNKEEENEGVKIEGKAGVVPNNAFAKLMQQRKIEPNLAVVEMKDAMVTNMLSALQSVKSDSEGEQEAEEERRRSRKERRQRKRSRRIARESTILSSSSERNSEEEPGQPTAEEIVRIQCKQVVGSFYPAKYVSDTVGLSVHLDKKWYTTKGFQTFIAPKASKFEVNLFVDDLPIHEYLEKRLELKKEEQCEEALPLKAVNQSRRRRAPSKKVTRSESKEGEDKDDEEENKENSGEALVESALGEKELSSGRRSGRIAKTASILQERLKKEEELDRQLKEREKKEKAATKRKHMEIRKALREAERGEKRKRRASVQSISSATSNASMDSDSSSDCEVEKVVVKKKSAKLAAIFLGKKEKEVVKEDPAVTARRKAFLMSSTPEVLRNKVAEAREREQEVEEEGGDPVVFFPTALNCHVRQHGSLGQEAQHSDCEPKVHLHLRPSISVAPCLSNTRPGDLLPNFMLLSNKMTLMENGLGKVARLEESSVLATLEERAEKKKSFPFRRVWDSLVKRRVEAESWEKEAREKDLSLAEVEERRIRGNRRRSRRSRGADLAEQKYKVDNPSALLWTGKYQPRCGADLVGNCESIKQLRTWLSSWLGASHGRRGSSSTTDLNTTASTSDTGSEWGSGSDGQEPDVERTAALINGPSGSGKTAAVFALAAELGFNVLEVNASSGRNGKAMLARLHEATQSQQVRREQGQVKEEGSSKKKALILFEDIDLVFDDLDDGFYGAVTTLVQQTKRPIVLTTSDQGFKILGHRALRCDPELIMWEAPDTREVASHLQALALVEGFSLSSHHLAKMVKVSSSMRQAVLQMQLYCQGNAVEEEDVISSEEEIEDEEKGNVSKAPQPDIKKWFKQLEGRARRAGKASRGRALPQPPLTHANSYCHRTWWGRLPHVERKEREAKYPLTAPVQTRHRIDPLKCKDLFDDEVSEEEMEVEASKELGKESTKLTREERKTNLAALEGMARHLDILSLEGEEGSALALSASLPLSSQVARVTMWTEGDRGRLAQEEVLESELVANREVMGWREACELVSGVRGIARLEEERRVETIGSGRRGASARFNHYFSHHCDVTLDDYTLAELCNTFC